MFEFVLFGTVTTTVADDVRHPLDSMRLIIFRVVDVMINPVTSIVQRNSVSSTLACLGPAALYSQDITFNSSLHS